MRIAILGSVALPIPPTAQGGSEWIAYYQAKGLSDRGHEVLLIGGVGTKKAFEGTKVSVFEIGKNSLTVGSKNEEKFDPSTMEASRKLRIEIVRLSQAANILAEQKDNYDVILNNMRGEAVFLPIVKSLGKIFVNVMHLNLFPELADVFREHKTPLITISNAQRRGFENLNFIATVYNGVDTTKFIFNEIPKDYLLMVGTIGRHKNQKAAINVAKKLNMPLILAGKIRDKDYFEELKKDIDGQKIRWIGEIGFEEKVKLYQQAKAFIFPINWEEPFGLVMIEAMACGTPVIAFNHGAIPEIVVDSLNGFAVENEEQMADRVMQIDQIKREECRKVVEEKFTVEKMVEGYEKALKSV